MKKDSKAGRAVLFAAGMIFVCAAVYFFIYNVHAYLRQFEQKDWETATAAVVNTQARREGRHGHYHTRYDIYYQYEANGNLYFGTIYGQNTAKHYGETFPVKYDPQAPENSTPYLEPDGGIAASGILGLLIFGLAGGFMMRGALRRKKISRARKRI